MAENYSECYHCPPVHPLLNRLTPYDLGEDFLAEGPWKGGWMPFADGCETMSISGKRDGRPLLYARDEAEERRIYYYILWPNLIVSVHPDYVLTHQAWPDGPNRSDRPLRPLRRGGQARHGRRLGRRRVLGHHEPRGLPRGARCSSRGPASRSWTAGRYSNQEASVHAFDIMVADRYANDGSHTVRGWRTETAARAGAWRAGRSGAEHQRTTAPRPPATDDRPAAPARATTGQRRLATDDRPAAPSGRDYP